MSEALPQGWIATELGQIVFHRKGKKPENTIQTSKDGYVPYILIDEMEGKPIRAYTDDRTVPIAKEEDILIVWDGSIGKTATGLSGAIGSTIAALTPIVIPSNFLEAFLKLSKPTIEQTSRGTGLQHINQTTFWPLSFPLPPLNEQNRIVAKLDKIMPRIDAVKERLDKVPAIIKRFRQTVLTAAVTGKLTEKWRAEHLDVERAEELLKHIILERKQAKKSSNQQYSFKITDEIDERFIDLEVPKTWCKTNVDSVSIFIVDCPHSTPKWSTSGKLCLRTTNFLPNKLDLSEVRFVSNETFKSRILRLKPQKGDVLYSREGGILGIACKIDIDEEICLGQRMMMFRISDNILNSYFTYSLNSPPIIQHVNNLIGGSAAPHINIRDIKKYPFPLPPLEEQREIVRQVDKLFALADRLESHYQKAKARLDKLSQSVLAKAFRGELVSTEAELAEKEGRGFESAEKLLERILEEKEKIVGSRQNAVSRKKTAVVSGQSSGSRKK